MRLYLFLQIDYSMKVPSFGKRDHWEKAFVDEYFH